MSGSPFERGLKRLRRRSANDDNKAAVQADTPVNTEATPGNSAAVTHSPVAAATPVLVVVPSSPGPMELATALVTLMVWALMAWRARRGEPPVS